MSDFRSAIAFAKFRPGSVVRRLRKGGFGVFDKSELRIKTFLDSTNAKEFPSEFSQLAKLEQFDSLQKYLESADRDRENSEKGFQALRERYAFHDASRPHRGKW